MARIKHDVIFRRSSPIARWWYQLDIRRLTVFDRAYQNAVLGSKSAIYNYLVIYCKKRTLAMLS